MRYSLFLQRRTVVFLVVVIVACFLRYLRIPQNGRFVALLNEESEDDEEDDDEEEELKQKKKTPSECVW